MTEDEKEVLAWLERVLKRRPDEGFLRRWEPPSDHVLRTIESVMAQPRLPEEPHIPAIADAISHLGYGVTDGDRYISREAIRLYHNHLRRRLTAPKTKKVWDVTYEGEPCAGRHYEAAAALFAAEGLLKRGKVVTITPREVEVPA